MFPLEERTLPSLPTSVAGWSAIGLATVMYANLIHNLPFYYRPKTLVVGATVGALGGWALHHWAADGYQRLEQRRRWHHEWEKEKKRVLSP